MDEENASEKLYGSENFLDRKLDESHPDEIDEVGDSSAKALTDEDIHSSVCSEDVSENSFEQEPSVSLTHIVEYEEMLTEKLLNDGDSPARADNPLVERVVDRESDGCSEILVVSKKTDSEAAIGRDSLACGDVGVSQDIDKVCLLLDEQDAVENNGDGEESITLMGDVDNHGHPREVDHPEDVIDSQNGLAGNQLCGDLAEIAEDCNQNKDYLVTFQSDNVQRCVMLETGEAVVCSKQNGTWVESAEFDESIRERTPRTFDVVTEHDVKADDVHVGFNDKVEACGSEDVGSDDIVQTDDIGLEYVVGSEDVVASDNVVGSNEVVASNNVVGSKYIVGSGNVESTNFGSDDFKLAFVVASDKVVASDNIIGSDYVVASDNVVGADTNIASDIVVASEKVVGSGNVPTDYSSTRTISSQFHQPCNFHQHESDLTQLKPDSVPLSVDQAEVDGGMQTKHLIIDTTNVDPKKLVPLRYHDGDTNVSTDISPFSRYNSAVDHNFDKLLQSDSSMMPLLSSEDLVIEIKSQSVPTILAYPKIRSPGLSEVTLPGNAVNMSSERDRQISGSSTGNVVKPSTLSNSSGQKRDVSTRKFQDHSSIHDIDMSALHRAERWLDADVSQKEKSSQASPSLNSSAEFSTLQEQQASWMRMFQLLEKQHECDLTSQYEQHQRNLRRIQQHMEEDLLRQQQNFAKKLNVHRDFLLGSTAPKTELTNIDLSTIIRSPEMQSSYISPRTRHTDPRVVDSPSSHLDSTARRSLTFETVTPPVTPEGIRPSRPTHSASMPDFAYTRNLSASDSVSPTKGSPSAYIPRAFTDRDLYKTPPKYETKMPTTSHGDLRQPVTGVQQENDLSLREKHAKHLADLHSYYESELQELRSAITSTTPTVSESPYKKVMEENLRLHAQLDEVEEDLNSSQRENSKFETRIQALQVRAEELMLRHEADQKQIASLHNSYDEVNIDRKQMEAIIADHRAKNEQLSAMLKQAYKMQDEQIQERKHDGNSYQKLMVKYDAVVRDNDANKLITTSLENKLYDARSEIVDLKRIISRLELENKRLCRESDNQRHKKRVANMRDDIQSLSQNLDILHADDLSVAKSQKDSPRELLPAHTPSVAALDESDAIGPTTSVRRTGDIPTPTHNSPLLKAEKELQRLRRVVRDNVGMVTSYTTSTPRSPTKYEPPVCPSSEDPPVVSVTRTYSSPQPVTIIDSLSAKRPIKQAVVRTPQPPPTTRPAISFDVDFANQDSLTKRGGKIPKNTKRNNDIKHEPVAKAVERVKSGDIIARPAWENIQTSTIKSSSPMKTTSSPVKAQNRVYYAATHMGFQTRDERLQSHLKTVQDLEKMYDHLHAQKVQMESALSRLPSSQSSRYRSRSQQEELETRLDQVERELGSVRMSLKRYNVIKSSA